MSAKKHVNAIQVLAAGFAAFFLASCTFLPQEEATLSPPIKEPVKVVYETIEVVKGTIENKIYGTGYFISVMHKDLSFENKGGRLKEIYVLPGDFVNKGDLIAELDTDSILDEITLQKMQLRKAQIAYNRVLAQSDPEESGENYDLELASMDVEMQQSRLNTLYQDLEQSKIVSPIDGEIVFTKEIKQQEYVYARDILATVADLGSLQLQYSGEKVSDFRLGMKVNVIIGKNDYAGEVVATPLEAPADADSITKGSIRVKVEGFPASVEIGSSAIIGMLLEKHEDVIVLPKYAVNIFASRKFVNVLINGIREERDVEIGIQTDTEVEIVKGLDLGELVITN